MINVYVHFVMSDGRIGLFTVTRACSMKNRRMLLDKILEDSGWTSNLHLKDLSVLDLVKFFVESGQAEALYRKSEQETVV